MSLVGNHPRKESKSDATESDAPEQGVSENPTQEKDAMLKPFAGAFVSEASETSQVS